MRLVNMKLIINLLISPELKMHLLSREHSFYNLFIKTKDLSDYLSKQCPNHRESMIVVIIKIEKLQCRRPPCIQPSSVTT